MRYGMHLLDGTRHDAPPVVAFLAASSRHAVFGQSSPLLPHKNRVVQPHPLNVGLDVWDHGAALQTSCRGPL
jgi:hypothetical protein